MKPDSMFWIRICIVHSILVTWNDSTTAIIRRFFSESNDCWCGSKTTTKKHLKLTFCPNMWKQILTNQIQKQLPPNNIWGGICTQKVHPKISLPKTNSREISTPKNQIVFWHEKLQKSKLIKIWKKGVVSSDFISSDSCFVTCYVSFLGFFGGDVSSFFLVEISLQMFFS